MKPLKRILLTLFGACVVFIAYAQAAPTVSISVSPTSGISPASTTVTWSSTGAAVCTKSGAWTGSAATSGSLAVSNLTATSIFTLTCSEAAGSAVLSWTPPTLNTDGSPLTNLAGYKVYQASTPGSLPTATVPGTIVPILISSPTATSYSLTGLPAGTFYWNMRASNSAGIDSDPSATVSKTISLASATASATFTVNTKPGPPATVTVAMEVYDLKNGKPNRLVGVISLGVECGPQYFGRRWGADWYEVPGSAVDWTDPTAIHRTVAAHCASS